MSYAVEPGLAQNVPKLKEDGDKENKDDYDIEVVTADTISFYFTNNQFLSYRVGFEIEREDYDRIKRILESIEYKENPSNAVRKSDTETPVTETK